MITLEQAKNLVYFKTIHHNNLINTDGSCERWRVNGKVKRWKLSPYRISIPLKHGLSDYRHITEGQLDLFHLESDCPRQ